MGQFSWMDCCNRNKQILDDVMQDVYLLVPNKFGGGHIKETCYDGYGHFGPYDVYDLIVDWNKEFIPELLRQSDEHNWKCVINPTERKMLLNIYEDKDMKAGLSTEETQYWEKRYLGIIMACYDTDNAKLPYPIKVTYNANATYENCPYSLSDPNHGWPMEGYDDDDEYDADDQYDDDDIDDDTAYDKWQNNLLWNILKEHAGHQVEIAIYGNPDDPADICLEDMDTNEVILDAADYTICAREDK